MYAIIDNSGRQYKVEEGVTIATEKQKNYKEGDTIEFNRVLMLKNGEDTKIGKPYLENVKVVGKVLENVKGKKIRIVKFRSRKNSKTIKGHRQTYTNVLIQKIEY
ncbi:MAG: large subunit ribosomal protein [Kosmotogales bacterium]|nr:large subunit ribosomal protein [Kosmotogales bacterium]